MKAALGFGGLRAGFAVEVFSGESYPVVDGRIRMDLAAYETKAFLIK